MMKTGAASAIGARSHNENDVTITIAAWHGLWIYGDWRHVATGCAALVFFYFPQPQQIRRTPQSPPPVASDDIKHRKPSLEVAPTPSATLIRL